MNELRLLNYSNNFKSTKKQSKNGDNFARFNKAVLTGREIQIGRAHV